MKTFLFTVLLLLTLVSGNAQTTNHLSEAGATNLIVRPLQLEYIRLQNMGTNPVHVGVFDSPSTSVSGSRTNPAPRVQVDVNDPEPTPEVVTVSYRRYVETVPPGKAVYLRPPIAFFKGLLVTNDGPVCVTYKRR